MKNWKLIISITTLMMVISGCKNKQDISLSGSIDYVGSADIYISQQPLHYKYSDKIRYPLQPNQNGAFSLSIPVDSAEIVELHINEQSYPLYIQPDKPLKITINRGQFPKFVAIEGYQKPWQTTYAEFWEQEQALLQRVAQQITAFREGDSTSVLPLYEERYQLAGQYFSQTPFEKLYFQSVGEYLVKRLEYITYNRNNPGFDTQKERQQVLQKARELNFFSFESLHAQRAGIRDFTNAFANTFGVADSLQEKYDQQLMQYDIKRLGYPTLDSARTSVLQYIDGRKARAYAQLHLVAERVGEMPLDIATPSYQNYLEEYSDFPRYTSFLESFYADIKSVSPGQPAIPFALPDANEKIVQMKDFRGKYVLLDFWASWCIPCLDAFPYMREAYQNYSRDQFEIVAISIEEDSLRWRQALEQFDNPWPQLYGGQSFQQPTFQTYRGGGIPFYVLVSPEGNIIRYNDVRPSFNLSQVLDSLITPSNP
ncbi:TlpA family protein disulfide reductase [Fodinibius salsisoli]|uniref:TlpA family protein disulfide reductase n=1 Tax=Fodinibius salsisoli TaxID=2820877 RepID=A0ABT3PPT2_9BACT|nr:TlpA disulfide reductase family protein [Fodinibius salsisoli]MCW9707841.1 TlpA family protein disulfide reductase [Fodinibius salsisoli]